MRNIINKMRAKFRAHINVLNRTNYGGRANARNTVSIRVARNRLDIEEY